MIITMNPKQLRFLLDMVAKATYDLSMDDLVRDACRVAHRLVELHVEAKQITLPPTTSDIPIHATPRRHIERRHIERKPIQTYEYDPPPYQQAAPQPPPQNHDRDHYHTGIKLPRYDSGVMVKGAIRPYLEKLLKTGMIVDLKDLSKIEGVPIGTLTSISTEWAQLGVIYRPMPNTMRWRTGTDFPHAKRSRSKH